MTRPLMRIPYTGPLPPAIIIPKAATTVPAAAAAIAQFLTAPPPTSLRRANNAHNHPAVLLTGAGISVASGLADYRGEKGTYRQNKSYRPIYFHEFVASHEARKRYWARSFLGWTSLHKSKPNAAHYAVGELGKRGLVKSVITQNVDSFHPTAHPNLPTVELHGFLRALVCLSCRQLIPRDEFQSWLSKLNPVWANFLDVLLESGALETENPGERRKRGFRTNPDGDADVPGAPYTTFRYPACPTCLKRAPILADGSEGLVVVDADGAWLPTSTAGILKPNVIMFGESISTDAKVRAEEAIDGAGRILVVGSSLATYSAFRLVKRAHDQGTPIGVLNLGGVRNEAALLGEYEGATDGQVVVRASLAAEDVLPEVLKLV
jgi:NAD-dependent deacetylase sirtuin 4